jgi:protein-tyrosine-phosphatase
MEGSSVFRQSEDIFHVVFVCTGNQARSPLAEALLRKKVKGLEVEVGSFGTHDVHSAPALMNAVSVGAAYGVDLRGHRSRPLAADALEQADLVIGFEPFHVAAAVVDAGAARERSFLLRELAGLLDEAVRGDLSHLTAASRVAALHRRRARVGAASLTLPDPAGCHLRVFEGVAAEIDGFTRRLAIDLFDATM